MNKRRNLVRKQNKSNREKKQNERKQKKEKVLDEVIDIGRFFEIATTKRKFFKGSNLHEIKNEILEDSTGDFELIGSILIGETEKNKN